MRQDEINFILANRPHKHTKDEVKEPRNEMKTMNLEPNYPNLLRWHLNGMATDSFDGFDGRRAALHSIMDITRYLAHKDMGELQLIMDSYLEKGLAVTVITADGTGTGRLMPDDSIQMDAQSCGCPVEYHTADCPLRFQAAGDDDPEEEEDHDDDPSLQDTTFDHADPSNY